jgi:hypothetical protein
MATNFSTSARLRRRDFLQVGTSALLGMTFADLLRGRCLAESTSSVTPAKSCIFVWLAGGPATIDMWDLKPSAPAEIRGEFRPIETVAPGVSICEHLPEMAKVMDRCVLVRSVSHTLAEHDPGTELFVTGHTPTPALTYPSLGAIATSLLPTSPGVPSYIALGDRVPGSSGFLGAARSPFRIVPDDLRTQGKLAVPVELPDGFSLNDLERRHRLLQELDRQSAAMDRAPLAEQLTSFQSQALDILRSNKTRAALNLEAEPEASRKPYGNSWAAQGLLAARRLVEAGVGFVTVSIGEWDTHGNNFQRLRGALLPQLDQALAALIQDLDQRGLLKDTLVYCAGEFGRTPHINTAGGRDHWSRAMSVLMAGGRLPRGQVYGRTDELGMEPTSGRCSPADLNATLLSLLGVEPGASLMTPSGRPIAAFGEGHPIAELVSG